MPREMIGKVLSNQVAITFSSVDDFEILFVMIVIAVCLGLFLYDVLSAFLRYLASGVDAEIEKRKREHNEKYGRDEG